MSAETEKPFLGEEMLSDWQGMVPGLDDFIKEWVVKKDTATPPRKLTEAEKIALGRASVETMAARALGEEEAETPWGALERMTRGWIVQRARGVRPTPLGPEDFRQFVRFVLEGLTQSVDLEERAALAETLTPFVPEIPDSLPDGRKIADVLREDPMYFAREHLKACL